MEVHQIEQDLYGTDQALNNLTLDVSAITNLTESVCLMCPYDTFVNESCTADSAHVCEECPVGEFSLGGHNSGCLPCQPPDHCGVPGACSAPAGIADTCIECDSTVANGQAFITPTCTACPAHTYRSGPSECTPCVVDSTDAIDCLVGSCQPSGDTTNWNAYEIASEQLPYYGLQMSSSHNNGPASNIFDGNFANNNYARSAISENPWIQVEFGGMYLSLVSFQLAVTSNGANNNNANFKGKMLWGGNGFKVRVSNDSCTGTQVCPGDICYQDTSGQNDLNFGKNTNQRRKTIMCGNGATSMAKYMSIQLPGNSRQIRLSEIRFIKAAIGPYGSIPSAMCSVAACTSLNTDPYCFQPLCNATHGLNQIPTCADTGCMRFTSAGGAVGYDSTTGHCILCNPRTEYVSVAGVCIVASVVCPHILKASDS